MKVRESSPEQLVEEFDRQDLLRARANLSDLIVDLERQGHKERAEAYRQDAEVVERALKLLRR